MSEWSQEEISFVESLEMNQSFETQLETINSDLKNDYNKAKLEKLMLDNIDTVMNYILSNNKEKMFDLILTNNDMSKLLFKYLTENEDVNFKKISSISINFFEKLFLSKLFNNFDLTNVLLFKIISKYELNEENINYYFSFFSNNYCIFRHLSNYISDYLNNENNQFIFEKGFFLNIKFYQKLLYLFSEFLKDRETNDRLILNIAVSIHKVSSFLKYYIRDLEKIIEEEQYSLNLLEQGGSIFYFLIQKAKDEIKNFTIKIEKINQLILNGDKFIESYFKFIERGLMITSDSELNNFVKFLHLFLLENPNLINKKTITYATNMLNSEKLNKLTRTYVFWIIVNNKKFIDETLLLELFRFIIKIDFKLEEDYVDTRIILKKFINYIIDIPNSQLNKIDNNYLIKVINILLEDYVNGLPIFKEYLEKIVDPTKYNNILNYFQINNTIHEVLNILFNGLIKIFECIGEKNIIKNDDIIFKLRSIIITTLMIVKHFKFNNEYNLTIENIQAQYFDSLKIEELFKYSYKFITFFNNEDNIILKDTSIDIPLINKCIDIFKDKFPEMKHFIEINNDPDIHLPDEFIDCILNTDLTEPVELPETKNYINISTARIILHEKEEHPFTKNKLTMKELIKYNEQPEVKDRISKLMKDLEKFKQNISQDE